MSLIDASLIDMLLTGGHLIGASLIGVLLTEAHSMGVSPKAVHLS